MRAARYCSTWVSQRAEARGKQGGGGAEHSPTASPPHARAGAAPPAWASPAANPGSDAGSQLPTPIFTRRLAARSQALQSPSAAQGGLSTVQVGSIVVWGCPSAGEQNTRLAHLCACQVC